MSSKVTTQSSHRIEVSFQSEKEPGGSPSFTFANQDFSPWRTPVVSSGETMVFEFYRAAGSSQFSFDWFAFDSVIPQGVTIEQLTRSSFQVTNKLKAHDRHVLSYRLKILDANSNPVFSPDPQIELEGPGTPEPSKSRKPTSRRGKPGKRTPGNG